MNWRLRSRRRALASASASSLLQIGWSTVNVSSLPPMLLHAATAVCEPSGDDDTVASPVISSFFSGFQPLTVTLLSTADEFIRGVNARRLPPLSTLSSTPDELPRSGSLTLSLVSTHHT